MNSVPVLEVRREVVVYEVVVALVVRDEGVVEVSGGILDLGLLSLPTSSYLFNKDLILHLKISTHQSKNQIMRFVHCMDPI